MTKTLREQVSEFHAMIGVPAPESPTIPATSVLRLRLRLIAEEFFEMLEAVAGPDDHEYFLAARADVFKALWRASPENVDLPAFIDALADLDFVVEGTRQVFGVDGTPIAEAVYQANMAKKDGPVDPVTGKKQKPPGWSPPDVAGELLKQGWSPPPLNWTY
jgi:predicted HAD superfamily Cof-like phosphohydrolase